MNVLRSIVRAVWLGGMFITAAAELLLKRPGTRNGRAEWLHRFCERAARRLGVRIAVNGRYPERGVVISNHLGYLDIVVFAAMHRCVFVSKAEVRSWPLLGWMTTMAGTVYVERGRGGSALQARSGMRSASEAGLPVVFFPEGTTTNGKEMLPFHSGLLSQALAEQQPVTAACIRYSIGSENDPTFTVEDDVAFWGDTPMLRHIFRFLSLRDVHAEVRFAEAPIAFTSGLDDRKQAAEEARSAVAKLADSASPETAPEPAAAGEGRAEAAHH